MGKPVEISSINDAQALGISIVHQELNLLKDLTVAENIYIGRENMNGILLDKKAQNERAQAHLDALNIKLDATHNVGRMTVAKQQMVEIAKALSYDNIRILILDGPQRRCRTSKLRTCSPLCAHALARWALFIFPLHGGIEANQRPSLS